MSDLNTTNNKKNWISQAISLIGFTYLSQIISLVFLPIVSRIFSPKDFGLYAAFISVLSLVSVFSTWRYYLAIALPKQDEDSRDLIWGCFVILLGTACILLIATAALKQIGLASDISAENMKILDLTSRYLPSGFILTGAHMLYSAWLMRKEKSLNIGVVRVFQVLVTLLTQITLKGLNIIDGTESLIVGMIIGQLIGVVALVLSIKRHNSKFFYMNAINSVVQLKKYASLPQTVIQTEFFNAIGKTTLPLILASIFSAPLAGLWYFCNSIIGNPAGVLTGTIWQVAHNRLARENLIKKNEVIAALHNFYSFFLALPISIAIVFRDCIPYLFGDKWSELPIIIPIYAILTFINSISNTASYFVLFGKYRQEGFYNILLTFAPIIIVVFGSQYLGGLASVYLYCSVGILLFLGLNIYWGLVTGNLLGFTINILGCLLINLVVMILATYLMKFSLTITTIFVAVYLFLYIKYILWDRFNALKNI